MIVRAWRIPDSVSGELRGSLAIFDGPERTAGDHRLEDQELVRAECVARRPEYGLMLFMG